MTTCDRNIAHELRSGLLENEIRRRVVLDLDLCIECRSCGAACFYGHHEQPIINYGVTEKVSMPVICRQCTKPACVAACPQEAMWQDDLSVSKRALELCTGCGSCIQACPFGVLTTETIRHRVPKCDLCEDRVVAGGIPRCVASCPSGALRFEEVEGTEQEGLLVLSSRTAGHQPLKRR